MCSKNQEVDPLFAQFITKDFLIQKMGLHGNLWVNQCEIHQNPPSVKQQSGIIAPVGRFYSVCHLTAARNDGNIRHFILTVRKITLKMSILSP